MSSNIGMEMTHELVDISLLNLPDLEPYLSELNHPKSKNPDFRTTWDVNRTPSRFKKNSHRLSLDDTYDRHIIPMKSQGFFQTPQKIMEEYNGCSVPQYTRYRRVNISSVGVQRL